MDKSALISKLMVDLGRATNQEKEKLAQSRQKGRKLLPKSVIANTKIVEEVEKEINFCLFVICKMHNVIK